MSNVLHLTKKLMNRPDIGSLPGISVRNYADESDILPWLELRDLAFARQRLGVRRWSATDFAAEFTSRWWWQPRRMWLAEGGESDQKSPVGSVTLAMRGENADARPVVHWLLVDSRFRRRGIARLLLNHLEIAAWDAQHRQIWLETHAAWEAAVKFYAAMGYETA